MPSTFSSSGRGCEVTSGLPVPGSQAIPVSLTSVYAVGLFLLGSYYSLWENNEGCGQVGWARSAGGRQDLWGICLFPELSSAHDLSLGLEYRPTTGPTFLSRSHLHTPTHHTHTHTCTHTQVLGGSGRSRVRNGQQGRGVARSSAQYPPRGSCTAVRAPPPRLHPPLSASLSS